MGMSSWRRLKEWRGSSQEVIIEVQDEGPEAREDCYTADVYAEGIEPIRGDQQPRQRMPYPTWTRTHPDWVGLTYTGFTEGRQEAFISS